MDFGTLIGVGVFLLLVLAFALVGTCKKKWKQSQGDNQDILAHRKVGFFLATLSLTGTMVGGVFINRNAMLVYEKGFAHTQPPWTYALSLLIGASFFARKMRNEEHCTMVDPLQERFGSIMGAFLSIPALVSDLLWCAALLSLFSTITCSITKCNFCYTVLICLVVVTLYTLTGGLYSVMYTHIIYVFLTFAALWLVVPFILVHPCVNLMSAEDRNWGGVINTTNIGTWLDQSLVLIFGGIPRQVYFQYVLSSKSAQYARVVSFASALGVLVFSLPSVIIGMAAKSTDWLAVFPENSTLITEAGVIVDTEDVFTMAIKYLSPYWVSVVALGGLCATVMSSADSALLSTSSLLTHNVYKTLFRKKASYTEVAWVYRTSVLFSALIAGALACFAASLTDLWIFSYDLVYVILFPQFLCATFLNFVNLYGSIMALLVGLILRLGGGEETIGLPVFIEYPYFDEVQVFPFRTFSMIMSLFALIVVSAIVDWWRPARRTPTLPPDEVSVLKLNYTDPSYEVPSHSFAQLDSMTGNYGGNAVEATELYRSENNGLNRDIGGTITNRGTNDVRDEM